MNKLLIILIIFISNIAPATENTAPTLSNFMGFSYEGKVINPKCVNLLQSWQSDSGIITRSIIIDSCQDSNLAFEGKNLSISHDGTVSYYEDPNDGHSKFGYRVVGRTLNNVFVLFHQGYIGLYRLREQNVTSDFSKNKEKSVMVLTKLSDAWMPCFISAKTQGNKLIIVKDIWDSSQSRAAQCTSDRETLHFDLSNF